MTTISFRGGESTGSVGDRRIDTAKQESTGSVGVRKNSESIFNVDNEPECDTVCFRGKNNTENKTSTATKVIGFTGLAATLFVLAGLAHKYDWVGKISNEKAREFFKHTDAVTEPCHKACAWIKQHTYDPIKKMFNGSK